MDPVFISLTELLSPVNDRWQPATEEEVQKAEQRIGFGFPPLLREFFKTYGKAHLYLAEVDGDAGREEGISTLFGCTGNDYNLLSYFDLSDWYALNRIIPFGGDLWGNVFAWSASDKKVYYLDYVRIGVIDRQLMSNSLEAFYRGIYKYQEE